MLTLQARAELEQLERVQRVGPQRGTAGGATEHAAAAMYADCPVPYPKGRAFYPNGRASRGASPVLRCARYPVTPALITLRRYAGGIAHARARLRNAPPVLTLALTLNLTLTLTLNPNPSP